MGMTPEGRVKKKVKEYLQSIGAWYYMPVSNGMGRVGCPDILVCYKGAFVALETKAPGKLGHVTANQQREIIGIQRANGLAHVVDNVEQVKDVIETYIQKGLSHDQNIEESPSNKG